LEDVTDRLSDVSTATRRGALKLGLGAAAAGAFAGLSLFGFPTQ